MKGCLELRDRGEGEEKMRRRLRKRGWRIGVA